MGGGGRLRKRGDVCNFSSLFLFQHPPTTTKQPWKNNVERGEEAGEAKVGGRVGNAEGGGRGDNNRLKTD